MPGTPGPQGGVGPKGLYDPTLTEKGGRGPPGPQGGFGKHAYVKNYRFQNFVTQVVWVFRASQGCQADKGFWG